MTQELEQKIKRRLTSLLGPISLGKWHQSAMFEWRNFVSNDDNEQWQITVAGLPDGSAAMTIIRRVGTVIID